MKPATASSAASATVAPNGARCGDGGLAIGGNPIVAGRAASDQTRHGKPNHSGRRDRPAPARRSAPVVIEARGLEKAFRIPEHRVDSLKERATHPFTRVEYRELRALRDVSFDVRKGEFFGIVGRNGSGKSTLLKILASIYRADAGPRPHGRPLAPFIELGVGFNPELTARENVVINGVLMGLTPREAGAASTRCSSSPSSRTSSS